MVHKRCCLGDEIQRRVDLQKFLYQERHVRYKPTLYLVQREMEKVKGENSGSTRFLQSDVMTKRTYIQGLGAKIIMCSRISWCVYFKQKLYFIMNQESESYRQDLYVRIGVMKDSKTKAEESTRLTYTGLRHYCCHTHSENLRIYY
jgi:hypothetical protein